MFEIFVLLGVYQLKHFIADYPLQNRYMLRKMNLRGWALPLFAHASIHAAMTLVISYAVSANLLLSSILSIFDLVIHFTMDRIKASPNLLNRFKLDKPQFWWILGFDQMIHHLTHYVIIYALITN